MSADNGEIAITIDRALARMDTIDSLGGKHP